jgi:hypothetical protein
VIALLGRRTKHTTEQTAKCADSARRRKHSTSEPATLGTRNCERTGMTASGVRFQKSCAQHRKAFPRIACAGQVSTISLYLISGMPIRQNHELLW